jgi:hypothetical protein
MRRIRIIEPSAPEVMESLLARGAGMPVRALEGLLNHGEAGLGLLILVVRQSVETHRCPGFAHWSAVGLGEAGDADAVPELATLMRLAWPTRSIDVGFSAAEAIGKIGPPAEEMLLRTAKLTPRHERYWFQYAAACMGTEAASDFVLSELERNRPLADSAALALALLGRTDALPALGRALRRVKPWQVPMLAEAIRSLHRNETPMGTYTRDWRLRYRYQPGLGRFPPLLPCLMAMLRSHPRGRRAAAGTVKGLPRSVDEVLEQAEGTPAREEASCKVCHSGRPRYQTGVVLCDDCAPTTARIQADCLLAADCKSNDIFDVLNAIDNHLMDHDLSQFPETDRYRRYVLARSACYWLIDQGIESAAAGVAMLLAEADTDAEVHTR